MANSYWTRALTAYDPRYRVILERIGYAPQEKPDADADKSPPKRKRGRPRKVVQVEAEAE
jgi:hypothetical protein